MLNTISQILGGDSKRTEVHVTQIIIVLLLCHNLPFPHTHIILNSTSSSFLPSLGKKRWSWMLRSIFKVDPEVVRKSPKLQVGFSYFRAESTEFI